MYSTTLPTIYGDSGSPVIRLIGNKVEVVGIRLAVRVAPVRIGFGHIGIPIVHMNLIGGSDTILPEIDKANEGV